MTYTIMYRMKLEDKWKPWKEGLEQSYARWIIGLMEKWGNRTFEFKLEEE